MKKRLENMINDSIAAHTIIVENEQTESSDENREEFYELLESIKEEATKILEHK